MSEPKITTNHVPRDLIFGYELTDDERREFDYIDIEELDHHRFFRYKGIIYDTNEFESTQGLPTDSVLSSWQGFQSSSAFHAVVIRFSDDFESVIVGNYTC